MRVIAGIAKGKKLLTAAGEEKTRPTTDRVKEAIFGSIQFRLRDACVLDLFCGSGALGIEALSRGAKKAIFVDADSETIAMTRKNLAETSLIEKAVILETDYKKALLQVAKEKKKFRFIFIDPPYASDFYLPAIQTVNAHDLLAEDGMMIVEHNVAHILDGVSNDIHRQKRYGQTYITFLERT
ncbi:MAG: 16S rRNA (guanine(966)-N(2))-methyltransferase RsmD [Christensenellaceae bacterium]